MRRLYAFLSRATQPHAHSDRPPLRSSARHKHKQNQKLGHRKLFLEDLEDRAMLAAGTLDPTFGIGGKVTTAVSAHRFGSLDPGAKVAIQSDGKIVVAGTTYQAATGDDYAIVRYNTDGSLDNSFGVGGQVTIDFGSPNDQGFDVALQPDGKVIVGGVSGIARLNADGALDASFGNGGKATVVNGISAQDIALQMDGKILALSGGGNSYVARLNIDGSPDNTFHGQVDGSGYAFAGNNIKAMAPQPDGKIVLVGNRTPPNQPSTTCFGGAVCPPFYNTSDIAVSRLNSDGEFDQIFGIQSWDFFSSDDQAHAVVVQSDGRIIAVGSTRSAEGTDFAVTGVRSGKIDFNGRGDVARSVAVLPDGKILIAGYSSDNLRNDFAVAQLNRDGSLDSTFGENGRQIIDFGSTAESAAGVAVQADGKIVLSGYFLKPDGTYDFAVARLIGGNTSAVVTSSSNPSMYGETVTFNVTVTSSEGTPTGTVTYFDGSTMQTATLVGGVAQFTNSHLVAGNHQLYFDYSGDANFSSTSASITQTITRDTTTSAVMTSSANPSTYAEAVTFTGTISANAGTPTGMVNIFENGSPLGGAILVDGTFEFITSSLRAGDHSIDVVYTGDSNFIGAYTTLSQTVNKADQIINFGPLGDRAEGLGPIVLSAYASSGQPVSFALLSGPAILDGYTLTITGVGTVVIEASQGGDDNFNPAVVNQSFAVIPTPPASRLDPNFGVGGKVTASLPIPRSMVITPDGKIVVLGDSSVTHFNSDGSLDTSFGDGGTLSLNLTSFAGAALNPDGSILVVSTIYQSYNDFAVTRLTPSGQLDTSFGDAGTVIVDFSELSEWAQYLGCDWCSYSVADLADDFATGLFVQSDGSIYAFGISNLGFNGFEIGVAVYLSASGEVLEKNLDFGGGSPSTAFAYQADRKLIHVGGLEGDFGVTRQNLDGFPDATFGLGGTQQIDFGGNDVATIVAVQTDGKIVVAGYQYDHGLFVMARLQGFARSVLGTAGDDNIAFAPGTQAGTWKTTVNGIITDNIVVDGEVLVTGLDGNDTITITAAPAGGLLVVAGEGSNTYDVQFGALAGTVNVIGNSFEAVDDLIARGTALGDYIFKDDTKVTFGEPVQETITYFGIESLTIHGGGGDDTIVDPGSDTKIFGDAGNDTILINATSGSGVFIDGGMDSDTYVIGGGYLAGQVTIADSGTSGSDSASIVGTSGDDAFIQTSTGYVLNGTIIDVGTGLEAASIDGGGGTDTFSIEGTPPVAATVQNVSDTTLIGTAGDDVIRLIPTNNPGEVKAFINGALIVTFRPTRLLIVDGLSGNDTISAEGVDIAVVLHGGEGNDVLTGGSADDIIFGDAGDDTITGAAGNDFLIGGTGKDRIVGSAGHDILVSGDIDSTLGLEALQAISQAWAGSRTAADETVDDVIDTSVNDTNGDKLTGGAGADLFIVTDDDIITDFKFGKPNTNQDGDVVILNGIITT